MNRKALPTTKLAKDGRLYTSESDIQIACVTWFRVTYPLIGYNLFAIPNQGSKGRNGAKFKAEGLMAGVPDLFLSVGESGLEYRRNYGGMWQAFEIYFNGLFIEMKTPDGKISPDQRHYHNRLLNAGYAIIICRSRDEFQAVIEQYMAGKFCQADHPCK